MLDELTLAGEVVWAGAGSLTNHDGWVVLAPSGYGRPAAAGAGIGHRWSHYIGRCSTRSTAIKPCSTGRWRTAPPPPASTGVDDSAIAAAIWDLVWAGWLTNDTLGPLRSLLGASRSTAHARRRRPPRGRYARYARLAGGSRVERGPSGGCTDGAAGHGRTVVAAAPAGYGSDPTCRGAADVLLDRYGLVTRGAVVAEGVSGGFSAVYPVLKAAEESGRVRRGYFVEGLGAAQFAVPGAIDRLRSQYRSRQRGHYVRDSCSPPPTRRIRTARRCRGRTGLRRSTLTRTPSG